MTDDLVKRARHNAQADMPHYASVELIETMADRIEELEAKLAKAAKFIGHLNTEYQPVFGETARQEIRELYAELTGDSDD